MNVNEQTTLTAAAAAASWSADGSSASQAPCVIYLSSGLETSFEKMINVQTDRASSHVHHVWRMGGAPVRHTCSAPVSPLSDFIQGLELRNDWEETNNARNYPEPQRDEWMERD